MSVLLHVAAHRWFSAVDWNAYLERGLDAPYLPPLDEGDMDSTNYDLYPELPLSQSDVDQCSRQFIEF